MALCACSEHRVGDAVGAGPGDDASRCSLTRRRRSLLGRSQCEFVFRQPCAKRAEAAAAEIWCVHEFAARELRYGARRVDFRKGVEPALMEEVDRSRREAVIPAWRVGQSLGFERDAPGAFEANAERLADGGVGRAVAAQRQRLPELFR